jgi:ribosomal protein L23
MKAPQDIVIRPIISEKMEYLQEAQRKYAFKVLPGAKGYRNRR